MQSEQSMPFTYLLISMSATSNDHYYSVSTLIHLQSTLSECPHLQRALVAARDALRDKTITPEMVLGKQLVPEALGENTRAALMRVEADDDSEGLANARYC